MVIRPHVAGAWGAGGWVVDEVVVTVYAETSFCSPQRVRQGDDKQTGESVIIWDGYLRPGPIDF